MNDTYKPYKHPVSISLDDLDVWPLTTMQVAAMLVAFSFYDPFRKENLPELMVRHYGSNVNRISLSLYDVHRVIPKMDDSSKNDIFQTVDAVIHVAKYIDENACGPFQVWFTGTSKRKGSKDRKMMQQFVEKCNPIILFAADTLLIECRHAQEDIKKLRDSVKSKSLIHHDMYETPLHDRRADRS
jgi:hypothetical protein